MQQLELNKDNLEGNTIPVCYDQERELQFMVNIIRCRYHCMFHWLRRFRSYRKLLQKKINFLYGNSHESDWPSSIQTNPLLFYPSVLIVDSIQMRSYPEYYWYMLY